MIQAKKDIEDKKIELQEARIVRQHMEEYEVRRERYSGCLACLS